MCQKREHRCTVALHLREQAMEEWCKAETFEQGQTAWRRLGGLVTLHRYGTEHFRLLALHRHGDPEALLLLAARMARRES